MTGFVQRGGGWLIVQMVLMMTVVVLGWKTPRTFVWLGSVGTGGALMAVGGVLALAGARALGHRLSPFPKPTDGSDLAQHGVYSLIRHPLYASVTITALGWALFRQSWPGLLAAIILAVFLDAKARREERWLLQRFRQYAAYQRRVRRFIPGLY